MKLKTCSCKKDVTTKSATRVIRDDMGLWFNCSSCQSTLFIRDKNFVAVPIKAEAFDWADLLGYLELDNQQQSHRIS